jgi:general secretion pathway protein D
MKPLFLALLLLFPLLNASECENKQFSLSAYQNNNGSITLMDLVRDVAQTCNISVVFEDRKAKERLSQPLDMVNIQDFTLDELFTFIFSEHNLFHTYDPLKQVVRVSYTKTVSFNIDYINMSELITESTKSITVGPSTNTGVGSSGTATTSTSSSSGSGSSGGGANSDYTNVRAISTFTFWDQLQQHIQQILQVDEEYNDALNKTLVNRDAAVVTITGTKRQIDSVDRYLKKLESRMHSQVMIEAHLIELTYNDYSSIGVNWSDFSLALTGQYSNAYTNIAGITNPVYKFGVDFNPAGMIDFLKTYGNVEVLSNPKILTLNNQPAVINVGQQLSYLYQNGSIASSDTQTAATTTNTLGSVFVGLTLNIIPEVTEDGYIIMRINPITSELLNDSELSSGSSTNGSTTTQTQRTMPPDTRVKQMTSIVKVKDTQKVLIGGLIEKKLSRDNTKIPYAGDIPLFGRLFNNDTDTVRKSELFILITPTLIKKDIFPTIDDALLKRFN